MQKQILQSACAGGENTSATLTFSPDEWGRLPKPKSRFWGLSRTTILEMVQRGEVRSAVIKKRGAIRGIRLIYLPSLREALNRLAGQGTEGGAV